MTWFNGVDASQIGDCSRNLQDAVMGPGSQTMLDHGPFEEVLGFGP